MAAELQIAFNSGLTVYALVRTAVGTIWNGVAFEAYVTANYANYKITSTEQGAASGYYAATFPSSTAGVYSIVWKVQAGGSPAEADQTIGVETFQWDGTAALSQAGLATSGQVGTFLPARMARGIAVNNYPFKLVSTADHVTPITSGIVSGQISRDGGAFGALQSGTAVAGYSEVGLGWYKVNLTSGDLLANTAILSFYAVRVSGGASDQADVALVLQRTSGQTIG